MNEFLLKAVERKPGISLDIALTARCPLSCRYCTVAKDPTPELRAAHWQEIIGAIASLRTIDLISLEGGEPLSRTDLEPILETSLQCARAVKIVTGGSLPCSLPDRLVADPRFHFEVSLDGPPPVHNFLRDGSHLSAYNFLQKCLTKGIRVFFRTVISRHNLIRYEPWLEEMDFALADRGEKVGFFFDSIIAPVPLLRESGSLNRAGIRTYPTNGLIPSPAEIWNLFQRVKRRRFDRLVSLQDEPIRGCQAARSPVLSFDPSGSYSFCCESPKGLGTILKDSPRAILARMDETGRSLPCRRCPHFAEKMCLGCWTGQKCGLVGHWNYSDCRKLVSSMIHQTTKPKQAGEAAPIGGF